MFTNHEWKNNDYHDVAILSAQIHVNIWKKIVLTIYIIWLVYKLNKQLQ